MFIYLGKHFDLLTLIFMIKPLLWENARSLCFHGRIIFYHFFIVALFTNVGSLSPPFYVVPPYMDLLDLLGFFEHDFGLLQCTPYVKIFLEYQRRLSYPTARFRAFVTQTFWSSWSGISPFNHLTFLKVNFLKEGLKVARKRNFRSPKAILLVVGNKTFWLCFAHFK